ncbi:MAG: hypothetical protein ACKOEP_04955, partial [Phycisphaerales bacterium]
MLKKLQTYNRQILAAVSVLLLIVFLAPTAVTQCSRAGGGSSGTVWARTADGTTLTLGDLQDMRAQLAVLEVMGGPVVGAVGASKSPEHWWLLVKEARDAGLAGGAGEGRHVLEQTAARTGAKPDDLLMQLASSARQQPQVVLETLANLQGVERLLGLTVGSRRLSDARTRDAAREMLTNASCEVVVLDGAVATKALPIDPPGEDRLATLFEAGKDQLEGAGPAGIGYRIPDHVRVEWLVVPSRDILASVASDPALGPVELRKEFRRDPKAFGVTDAELAPGAPPPSYEAYAPKVRDAVERRLVKDRADRIAGFVRDWNRTQMKDIPVEGGMAKLPEDWKDRQPALKALAAELGQRFSVGMPQVADGGGWLTPTAIEGTPLVGTAISSEYGRPMGIGAMVRAMRAFDPESRLPIQVGVVGPVAVTPGDDVVVWRLTAAEKAHPPASLDEVRAAVTRDAEVQARYERLAGMTDELARQAATQGLAQFAAPYLSSVQPAPMVHVANLQTLNQVGFRLPGSLPKVGSDADAIRAVVRRALALPAGAIVSTLPDSDRIVVIPVESKRAVLVVRINDVTPLYAEDYGALAGQDRLASAIMQDEPEPDLDRAATAVAV